jgi:aryl-phospho-beta-D-glucosidase BglC (GH1 family)
MGIIFEKYRSGINLGGWISQCNYKKEHVTSFINREDVKKIASWGLDHIRLPFDYIMLEDDNNPFSYKEDGFGIIDKLLGWCKEASLNLVLDMHNAPGYAFGNNPRDNIIFTDETTQKRFVSLWQEMAKRYKNEKDNVVFELLNEIVDAHGQAWNKIARKAIEGIRCIDTERYILLGGPNYNSAEGLDSLEIWDDERVLYNFHFYEPFLFTHQRASWTQLKNVNVNQPYPGKIEGIDKLISINQIPEQYKSLTADTVFDKTFLEQKLAPAIAFAKRTNKELYCGEYGAIDHTDLNSRINYLQDTNELFEKYRIGRACWTYKGMNFTAIDKNSNPVSEKLVKALTF